MSEEYRATLEKQCDLLGIKYTDKTRTSALKLSIYLHNKPEEPEEVKKPPRSCKFENCGTKAIFGEKGIKIAEYCKTHAPENYVDINNKRCVYENCSISPTYGIAGSKLAEYCSAHAPENYVNVKSKHCIRRNCTIRANFGLPGTKLGKYCSAHAPENYIDINNKRCVYENCNTQPIYGITGSKTAEYCKVHAPKNYTDIKNKRCIHENCNIQPIYGIAGSKLVEYCSTHAPENYVNVKDKRCIYENCNTHPIYGLAGSKLVEYCKTHAPEDYVNVKDKRCIYENCDTHPNYGLSGSKLAEYCKTHAPENYIDIRHKRCKHTDCSIRPHYGMPGYSAEYCSAHMAPGMILNPTKSKKEVVKECTYCAADIHYGEEFCSGCKNYIKIGATVKRHAKELAVKALLDSHEIKYIHDRVITGGCSKKRPDFVIPTEWGTIIIEVDEHQHNRKTYTCECEITRMGQIYFDVGVENLLFIRYNPDDYKPITGVQMTVKSREDYLIKYLKKQMAELTFKGLGAVYLFYDGFERTIVPEIDLFDPYH